MNEEVVNLVRVSGEPPLSKRVSANEGETPISKSALMSSSQRNEGKLRSAVLGKRCTLMLCQWNGQANKTLWLKRFILNLIHLGRKLQPPAQDLIYKFVWFFFFFIFSKLQFHASACLSELHSPN